MNTNSALIIPAQSPAAGNAAQAVFRDTVKPLIKIADVWFWIILIAVIAAVLVIAWLLWRHWKRKKAAIPAVPPVPPHVRARQMLESALALISEPKPFTIEVSGTLRTYLEERFDFRAPERTTEEFLYELQGTNLLTAEQKLSLADFLANCDLIKFAKYEPTETELRALHTAALRLVNETEPRWAPPVIEPATAEPPAAVAAEK
jgi:hypothetical protein